MKTLLLPLVALFFTNAALADPPAVHGMLLFGKNKIYVSHLPMFHPPHDYQLLAELELPPEALNAYRDSRAKHPEETVYTLVPEKLPLPELVAHPHPFHADLYRGHFERGGTVIASAVSVNLGKVLFWRKFVPSEPKPAVATYLLFGDPSEAYLAHRIVARPDFDQVLELGANAAAQAGVVIPLDGSEPDTQPLSVPGHYELHPHARMPPVTVDPRRELYLETGDLSE